MSSAPSKDTLTVECARAFVRDVDQHPGQELERVNRLGARRRALGLVGPVRHRRRGPVVGQPLQGDGIPRAVVRESGREGPVLLRHPDGRVDVEPRVRPGEHAGGRRLIKQLEAHEEARRNLSTTCATTGRHGPYSRAKRSS